jgi:hypothetical protein
VPEIFQRELLRVLSNIEDVNTPTDKKRKITLVFTVIPYEDRSGAELEFSCSSQLAPVETVEGRMYLGRVDGKIVAVPHNPRQPGLFPASKPDAAASNVTPISSTGD